MAAQLARHALLGAPVSELMSMERPKFTGTIGMLCRHSKLSFTAQITRQGPATAAGSVLERSACYGPADLRMGSTVSVYGRTFLIVDCDDFTRKWLLVSLYSL